MWSVELLTCLKILSNFSGVLSVSRREDDFYDLLLQYMIFSFKVSIGCFSDLNMTLAA